MAKTHYKHPTVIHPSSSLVPKFSGNAHFADFKPTGLPRLWTHTAVNMRHFAKDYGLPLTMTAIFLLLILVATVIRISQRSSLATLLANATTVTQDYNSLTSSDKTNAPVKDESVSQEDASQAPPGSSSSFSITPTPTPSTPGDTGSGSGFGSSGGSTGGGGGTTTAPFSAAIAFFRQDDAVLECTTPKPNKPTCSKRYIFSAAVNTQNGPGVVNYGWRSNFAGASEDNNYAASSGSAQKILSKSITIDCLSPGTYSMQFVVLSPTQVQSAPVNVVHNCIGI